MRLLKLLLHFRYVYTHCLEISVSLSLTQTTNPIIEMQRVEVVGCMCGNIAAETLLWGPVVCTEFGVCILFKYNWVVFHNITRILKYM